MNKKYVAICLFCKNENEYLKEWIEYHLSLDVDHIFIYDNNSKSPLANELRHINCKNKVTVELYNEHTQGRHVRCYNKILKEKKEYKWLGFIDTDEFIVVKGDRKLPEILNDYKDYAGLALYWRMFGSNNHITKQSSQILPYTKRSKLGFIENNHVKSFIKPEFAIRAINEHFFEFKGNFCVDENKERVYSARQKHTSNSIWINHYVLRSREEFYEKISRGSDSPKDFKFFEKIEKDCNEVNDFELRDQYLKKRLLIL